MAAPTYGQDVHPAALCNARAKFLPWLETSTDVKIQCVEKVAMGRMQFYSVHMQETGNPHKQTGIWKEFSWYR